MLEGSLGIFLATKVWAGDSRRPPGRLGGRSEKNFLFFCQEKMVLSLAFGDYFCVEK